MIELRMLGEIRLTGADGAELDALLRLPKRLALLAYLASPVPGTWHRRDMLLALFWPELDTARARTALRNALHVLRQHVGDQTIRARGDEEVSVDPGALRTDLAALWEVLRSDRPEESLELYSGELLAGLYPADSDGFMRWLDTERARVKVAVTSAGRSHADALEAAGDLQRALAITRRVLEIQTDDETLVRRVMELHDRAGDRAGALATFEGYRKRLAAEFAAEPAPETVALAARLREPHPDSASALPARSRWRFDAVRHRGHEHEGAQLPSSSATPRPRRWRNAVVAAGGVILLVALFAPRGFARSAPPQSIGAAAPLTSVEELEVQAAIAPNGRLVAYARGTTRHLRIVVQRINGGEPWPLTVDSVAVEQMPRWSPDNDQILYLSQGHAWVAPSLGGRPRLVARGAGGDGAVRSAAWSPTGDSVAIVRNDSLLVLPLRGPGSRFLGRGRQIHACDWAPDGRWIACTSGNWIAYEPGPLFGNRGQSAVVLFSSGGGEPIDLTGSAYQHHAPAWSADGRYLWILSDREGVQGGVFAVPIGRDGRASGPFVRVGLTAESMSLSRDRIAYTLPHIRRANIWAVPVPGDAVSALSSTGRRITSGTHLIEIAFASPDRKWLVYDSNVGGNADIFRIPIGGGAAEQLIDDPRPDYAAVLSPDGRELAWHRWIHGVRRLFVKRLDSDALDSIPGFPGDQGGPQWSPDGRAIAGWSHENEEGAIIVARRDAAGRWSRSWRLDGGQIPAWSPDARTLAFVRYDGSIETIPIDSGPRHRVYAPRPGTGDPRATYPVWNLDPSTIWFLANEPAGGGIWSVPAAGGEPRLRVSLDDAAGRAHGPSLSTDGSNFYITLDERFSNVWWAELRRK